MRFLLSLGVFFPYAATMTGTSAVDVHLPSARWCKQKRLQPFVGADSMYVAYDNYATAVWIAR